ncbi:HD domain-containing protein [Methylobacterium fujisawaense]|uniref:HD domain-containing protein n=1 Tax=Methylobacterium fujisawaense TaxID=107400 RepID=UPI003CF280E5
MVEPLNQNSVWLKMSSQPSDGADVAEHKELLRATFKKFRERASVLVSHISSELPSLTVHDITHLDALWETAEIILGDAYPLTPMEVFVLGGAILLHDSALCFEAYEGGRSGLRDTIEWKDSYASEAERDPTGNGAELEARADFAALRTLHAIQAERLATRSWKLKEDEFFYLIEDTNLRSRYGSLIGKIAASHHWPIDRVANELSGQINAPGHFPRDWRVDPIKLACILRCADAAHIDERRAPDFLNALLRRQGLSADHWKAQNWLNRIDADQHDPTGATLIITSSHEFGPDDADAWWVAFDAAALIDAELRSSNALLSSRNLQTAPPFKAQQVVGATSPDLMANYIRTVGWEPTAAKLHVSNIEQLISRLGGTSLYGSGSGSFAVAIRELLQNARDAIAARRAIDENYCGRINVTFRAEESDPNIQLIDIEDDGVGMSYNVLTGPLLDFGTSFWASNLLREEFPGLKSSNFRSVGRFGVGFYSIFMIADSAVVSSRKYDEGLSDVRTLSFPRGLTLRPILSTGRPIGFSTTSSTKITLKLKPDFSHLPSIDINRNYLGAQNFKVTLGQFVSSLAAGCDVDIYYRENQTGFECIHRPLSALTSLESVKSWLYELSFASCDGNVAAAPLIERDHSRVRPLVENGEIVGLAAISIEGQDNLSFMSAQTVGGFVTSMDSRGASTYVGVLDHEAGSAKREARTQPKVSQAALQSWADDQMSILRSLNIEPLQWVSASYAFADLDIDPTLVFHTVVSRGHSLSVMTLDEIVEYISHSPIAIFKSGFMHHVETHHNQISYEDYLLFRPLRHGTFLSLELKDERPVKQNSFLGCLYRKADTLGLKLEIEIRNSVADTNLGIRMDVMIIRCLTA